MAQDKVSIDELAVMVNNGFQTVTGAINKVETRLDGVETRLDGVETRLERVETEVKELSQKITQIDLRTQNQIDAQYERMTELEKRTDIVEEHIGLKPATVKP